MTHQPLLVSPGQPEDRAREDVLATLAFGIAPLLIVLAMGWELRLLILVIWFDTALAGAQALAMIAHARKSVNGRTASRIAGGSFFVIHYGGFTAAFSFIAVTAYQMLGPTPAQPNADGTYSLDFAAALTAIAAKPVLLLPPLIWRILRYRRFLAREEGRTASVNGMMGFAYISCAGFWFVAPNLALAENAGPSMVYWLVGYRLLLDTLDMWLRTRAARDAAAAPLQRTPAPRGIAFDVRTAPRSGEYWMIGAGIAFMALGAIIIVNVRGNLVGPAMLAFATLWTGLVVYSLTNARRRLARALDNGSALVVEGPISGYAFSVTAQKATESFSINGVQFAYAAGLLDGGFNRTAAAGGPVRDAARLRVHYVRVREKNVIAKLEVLG
ncbi:MAG: DUF6498-containing protein [Hyphomonadaceae bacterium]